MVRYFNRPTAPLFHNILYTTFFETFIHIPPPSAPVTFEFWQEACPIDGAPTRVVRRRTRVRPVSRIQTVRPGHGEVFYIRMLLFHQAARSFDDLRTVDGILHDTFQSAAHACGLLEHNNEGELVLEDAIADGRAPFQLRFLFVLLIREGAPGLPLWQRFSHQLSSDYSDDGSFFQPAEELALDDIQRLLLEYGCRTSQFGLPDVNLRSAEVRAELTYFSSQSQSLHFCPQLHCYNVNRTT